MKISRRSLLGAVTAGCGGYLAGRLLPRNPIKTGEQPSGLVFGLGADGSEPMTPGPAAPQIQQMTLKNGKDQAWSVFWQLDLSTGEFVNRTIPLSMGHQVGKFGKDSYLCIPKVSSPAVVFNPTQNKITKAIHAPGAFVFSGHYSIDDSRIFLPMSEPAKAKEYGGNKPGKMLIVNADTLKVMDEVPTPGYSPHQINAIPNTSLLALSFMGRKKTLGKSGPFNVEHSDAKIVILDKNSLSVKNEIKCDINSSFSHFGVTSTGYIVMPCLRWANRNAEGIREIVKAAGTKTSSVHPVSIKEHVNDHLGTPEPIYIIHPERGIERKITDHIAEQRWAQSVFCANELGYSFVTFSHSDVLMRISHSDWSTQLVSSFGLGISDIGGVTVVPKTRHLVVNGGLRGVVVIDADSLKVVKKYPNHLYRTIHISSV